SIVASYGRFAWLRNLIQLTPSLLASIPTFVIGIFLLEYFSFQLHWIPAVDDGSFTALLAPAVALGLGAAAPLAQVLTTSIRKTRAEPFVHVAQAKGAGERRVFRLDVLRNSVLPLLTLLGLTFGELIAGSIVTETVFARNGIGSLTVTSVENQDLPVVQGVVLVAAAIYVLINLLVDLAYPLIDPRILLTQGRRPRRIRRLALPTRPTGVNA
ncbi:MAG: peptide transporter permease, partial [Frondihabitans sp.]|nr:peptide transporter permease [Frondihabitans sp.]